jgi:hypothetical protein
MQLLAAFSRNFLKRGYKIKKLILLLGGAKAKLKEVWDQSFFPFSLFPFIPLSLYP